MYPSRATPIAFAAFLVCCCCCLGAVTGQEQQKLNVDVYYESLCPDSIYFITKELVPAYNGGFKDYLNINFIPFGKASWSDNEETNETEFSCQHGPSECRGNRAQACALHEIEKTESAADQQQQKMVDIVNCVMSNRNPSSAVPQCARNHGFSKESVESIQTCSRSKLGNDLLIAQGSKTKAFEAPLKFVPSIVINGVKKSAAFTDFTGVICQLIPSGDQLSICRQA